MLKKICLFCIKFKAFILVFLLFAAFFIYDLISIDIKRKQASKAFEEFEISYPILFLSLKEKSSSIIFEKTLRSQSEQEASKNYLSRNYRSKQHITKTAPNDSIERQQLANNDERRPEASSYAQPDDGLAVQQDTGSATQNQKNDGFSNELVLRADEGDSNKVSNKVISDKPVDQKALRTSARSPTPAQRGANAVGTSTGPVNIRFDLRGKAQRPKRGERPNFRNRRDRDYDHQLKKMISEWESFISYLKESFKSSATRKDKDEDRMTNQELKSLTKIYFKFYLYLMKYPFQLASDIFYSISEILYDRYPNEGEKLRESVKHFFDTFHPSVLMGVGIVVVGVFYSFYCLLLMLVAKTFSTENYWMAWIPIGQELLLLKMADRSAYFLFFYFIPFVQFMIPMYLWWRAADALNKKRWCAVFMIIPGINILMLLYFLKGHMKFSNGKFRKVSYIG